jgi:hypothetical protein
MTLSRAVFGWIARHALLFVLILAALVIHARFSPDAGSRRALETSIANLAAAEADGRRTIAALEGRAVTGLDAAQRNSLAAIDTRLADLGRRRMALQARPGRRFDILTSPRDAIIADTRRKIDGLLIDQEAAFLVRLRANVATRGRALTLDGQISAKQREIARLDAAFAADAANIAALPPVWAPTRYVIEGGVPRDLADVYARRQAENRRDRAAVVSDLQRLASARLQIGEVAALATPEVATEALAAPLAALSAAAEAQQDKLTSAIEREARRWYARLGIADLLWPAAGFLALIILTPFLVRTLFYWVLAPLAALQKPIQLLDSAAPIPLPKERSAVSKAIALTPDTELLVRQGFEQTISLGGTKATQWLLDIRHPLSSLVSGLYFLTRIRGQAGDIVTVSATEDPFAEVATLALPKGAAAVLQPRAIAGVVQPIAAPLRITGHWRLGTLNAWLTWQLRFLVFHGPAEIILTGGRGVRIEPALAGRSIGQDQLIGFSAGIAYSTGRTETFIPYLLGREPLLKDRVAAGSGILIAEEAPRAGRGRAGGRRGLEGAVDAMLKVFGI